LVLKMRLNRAVSEYNTVLRIEKLYRKCMKDIKAVVLAAGFGTRMKTEKPKVLHRVGSETILGRIISSLKKTGIKDIVIVVGYKAEMIEKEFKNKAVFVRQKELLGSGDALKCALAGIKNFKGDLLVTCGDAPLMTPEIFENLRQQKEQANAACVVLTCDVNDPFGYGRIVRDGSGKVTRIVEEKDASGDEKRIKEINVGTYCFDAEKAVRNIGRIQQNNIKKEFYLTDIIDILVKDRETVAAWKCREEEATGVNCRKDLAVVNKILNKAKIEKLMESGVTVVDPDAVYVDETAVIGKDTIIYPFTVIEEDVVIEDECRIGPFARIRPGSRICKGAEIGNFVEICRTEVGEGTKVKHHTYLGDSVVGKGVNIGAGTITANYDGKNKNRTVIKDGAFVGVGATLIAPVTIGEKAVVGAGSVVTKNKNVKNGETVVGVPARTFRKNIKAKGKVKNG